MARTASVPVPAGEVTVVFSDRTDGDFAITGPPDDLLAARQSLVDAPWTWLTQVHGARVVEVEHAGQWAGTEADGAVTATPGCPLAIMTADCAPVVLVADRAIGVVHAGWRGIVAGVIEEASGRLADLGAEPVTTMIGPCIAPTAYEFGAEELAVAAERLGPEVRGETAWGTPALDVPKAVALACERAGWPPPSTTPACTSDERWFSHRTRADVGRQATVAWIDGR